MVNAQSKETNPLSKDDLKSLMVDVRKAHRLIYMYQRCMLDLANRVGKKYKLGKPIGRKRFSSPIKKMRISCGDTLSVSDIWAWDFLYSYVFEYTFNACKRDKMYGHFSIFQVTDNGYFLSDGKQIEDTGNKDAHLDKKEIERFWDAESSSSYIILAFDRPSSDKKKLFGEVTEVMKLYGGDKDLIEKNHEDGNKLFAKRYATEEFFSEESIEANLNEFAHLVKERTGFSLIKE